MAAATLPAPGAKYGPCKAACEHTDCAESRRMAKAECSWCDGVIGYDTGFFQDKSSGTEALVHALCEITAIDEGRA